MKLRRTFFSFAFLALFIGIACGVSEGQVGAPITPKGVQIIFAKREMQAQLQIRTLLQNLRQDISIRRLSFQVGYTTALDFKIAQITGAVVPPNFAQLVPQQNAAALQILKALKAPTPVPACSPDASSFDWRQANGVTSVKDQGACGSCWAFGTVGAFEGSWRVFNGQVINASEQDILDCNPWGYSCEGGWWAFQQLIDSGVASEACYPYTHIKGPCHSVARLYKAVAWAYVGTDQEIPSVAQMKRYLCTYGPLGVAVRVTPAFQAYTGGVFNEGASGNINHAVTLIGWDDTKQAWLIKNSWGTGWGSACEYGSELGYMWIHYNSNSIGYAASWVRAFEGAINLSGR
jgi:cathepsin L